MSVFEQNLQVGDLVEVGPLLGNLTEESVVAAVEFSTDDSIGFALSYFGVSLGVVVAQQVEGGVQWVWP